MNFNVYLNYNDISFNNGESYAKMKAKVKNEDVFTDDRNRSFDKNTVARE